MGAALKRRVSGSAGADERRGVAKARIAGSVRIHIVHARGVCAVSRRGPICGGSPALRADPVHAHAAHPPRAVPVQAPVVLGFSPRQLCIFYSVPGLLCDLRARTYAKDGEK